MVLKMRGLRQRCQSPHLNLSQRLKEWTRLEAVRVVTTTPPPPAHYFHFNHPSSEGHLQRLIISSRSAIPSSHMADTFIPSSLQYHGRVHYWHGFPPEEINQRKHESQCKHPHNAVPTSESEYVSLLNPTESYMGTACRTSLLPSLLSRKT